MRKIVFMFFLLALTAVTCNAIPLQINYQGILKSSMGNLVTSSSVPIVFSIYGQDNGGSALWTETQTVSVSNGVYFAKLGSVNPINSNLFDGNIKYLGIKVSNDSEMTPRLAMISVPYAYRAGDAETLNGYTAKVTGNGIIPITGSDGKLNSDVLPSMGTTTVTTAENSNKLGGYYPGITGPSIVPTTDAAGKLNVNVIPKVNEAVNADKAANADNATSAVNATSAINAINSTNAMTAETLSGYKVSVSGISIIPTTDASGFISKQVIPTSEITVATAETLKGYKPASTGINIIPVTDGSGKLDTSIIPATGVVAVADNSNKLGGYYPGISGPSIVPTTDANQKLSILIIPTSEMTVNKSLTSDYATTVDNTPNSDTVDGLHASTEAKPNTLYPLDNSGGFSITGESVAGIIQGYNTQSGVGVSGVSANGYGVSGMGPTVGILGSGAIGVQGLGTVIGVQGAGLVGISGTGASLGSIEGVGIQAV